MQAVIISVFNQKGGCGKTTVAMHLAAGLCGRNKKVMLVDMDPQSTATVWASQASDSKPFPVAVVNMNTYGAKVHMAIQKHVEDYDFIVIDCPPAIDNVMILSVLTISDLTLIPVGASPAEVWAAKAAKEIALEVRDKKNPNLKVRMVASAFPHNSSLADAMYASLQRDEDVPVMKSKLSSRVAFKECMLYGTTALTMPGSKKAASEVHALVKEVKATLKEAL